VLSPVGDDDARSEHKVLQTAGNAETASAAPQVIRETVQCPSPRPPPPSALLTLCTSSFPFASPQNHLPTIPGSSHYRPFSPSRAVKTTADATPRQLSPRSRPHIARHVYHCYYDIPSHFCMFPCHSFAIEFPLPLFYIPFLFSTRHRTTPFTSTRVAYLYITLSSGPGKIIVEPME